LLIDIWQHPADPADRTPPGHRCYGPVYFLQQRRHLCNPIQHPILMGRPPLLLLALQLLDHVQLTLGAARIVPINMANIRIVIAIVHAHEAYH
jgi:hypothetical protein